MIHKEKLVNLCLATLLKDFALVSPKIKLDKKEIFLHPIKAYEYFKANYELKDEILDTILHHHEHFDGTGYPNRLKGEEISEFARIISIIDMFYAIKSDNGMFNDSSEQFEYKINRMVSMFDTRILVYFFANAELFTLDSLVRLNNGDIAVVVENNCSNAFRPVVKIVRSNTYKLGEVLELQNHSELKITKLEYYVED